MKFVSEFVGAFLGAMVGEMLFARPRPAPAQPQNLRQPRAKATPIVWN
jgi:hypothetical protein